MRPDRPQIDLSRKPLLCLVTDRRRLRGSERVEHRKTALVSLATEAAGAGVDLIQVRERDLEAAELVDLVAAVIEATRDSAARVVVNDRLDVALASGADGVHLRGDSIPPASARTLAPPGFLIGRSVHAIGEARDHAAAVDYLIAGTVFPTASKPSADRFLGPAGLKEIVEAVNVPVLAIGGITEERTEDIAGAGAAGFAAIGLFLQEGRRMSEIVASIREGFDSVRAHS